MYYIVQFICDNIFHVCTKNEIRKSKNNTMARYGRIWYDARVVCKNKNGTKLVLEDICFNLNHKHIIVDLSKEGITAKGKVVSCFNEARDVNKKISFIGLSDNLMVSEAEEVFSGSDGNIHNSSPIICKEKGVSCSNILAQNIDQNLSLCLLDDSTTSGAQKVFNIQTPFSTVRIKDSTPVMQYKIVENVVFEMQNIDNIDFPSGVPKDPNESGIEVIGNCSNRPDDEVDMLLCPYCGTFFSNLHEHILNIHSSDYSGYSVLGEHKEHGKIKYSSKQHFCIFCKTLQSKLARHLERKHRNELQVQTALEFPKGNLRRKSIFLSIQKNGDFCYNCNNNESIDVRRCHVQPNTTERVPCPFCKGYYSRKNLRNHVRRFCDNKEPHQQNLQVLSRSIVMKIHKKASESLRSKIFPPMRNDDVTRAVLNDELVIAYANLLVTKYSASDHHHKMIRNKLRHIGRILLEMKKIDPIITDVTHIYDVANFDTFIKAVHNLAGLKDGKFSTPSFGPSSVTLFSQVGDVLQVEAIKRKDDDLEKNVQRFLKLLTTTSNSLINKVASENRTQLQRSQVVTLPKTDDVKKLFSCLDNKMKTSLENLQANFDLNSWIILSKATLVKVMIFNRKRPGDIEKSQITEFNNLQMVDEDTMDKLQSNEKKYATMFGRYITRGKLDSPAPVLVSLKDIDALKLLLKYRTQANIDQKNPYLFAAPIGQGEPYYKAGKVLSDYCKSEGLDKNLSATKLRKHLATVTSTLQQSDQALISDFMGHALNIHNKIYRQRPVVQDVVTMGKFLNGAMGMEVSEYDNTSETSDTINNENSSNNESQTHHLEPTSSKKKSASETVISSGDEGSVYEPNLSTIIENEDESSMDDVIQRKNISRLKTPVLKRRFVAKRTTWTTPERRAARDVFHNYLIPTNDSLPSLETCQEFIHGNQNLRKRAPNQVRAWISSEKKRMAHFDTGEKRGWNTPMKEICRSHFHSYYSTESYPSTAELQNAIGTYDQLSHITVEKLRSHIQHDFKYLKRKSID